MSRLVPNPVRLKNPQAPSCDLCLRAEIAGRVSPGCCHNESGILSKSVSCYAQSARLSGSVVYSSPNESRVVTQGDGTGSKVL
jgi:hypothetical protein